MTAAAARAGLTASAATFAALGDPTRLELLHRLCDGGPQSIARLTAGLRLTRQAVSKHLRVLEGAGLVKGARAGRESRWEMDARRLEVARRYLDLMSARWDERLDSLRRFVEEPERK